MKPRPPDNRYRMISFRLDDEGFSILERLEAATGPEVASRGKRSYAIRKALIEAGERLDRRR